METKNTTRGFWMETEPLFPENYSFDAVVIKPEKGVIFMRTDKNAASHGDCRDDVKVIAI
ncbi:MAG: hypothetical protein EOO48_02710 [Flavobacterium sp.]|nr:MAG: hypothetical protein EOO48_02710 [Flavobacterium sp.]